MVEGVHSGTCVHQAIRDLPCVQRYILHPHIPCVDTVRVKKKVIHRCFTVNSAPAVYYVTLKTFVAAHLLLPEYCFATQPRRKARFFLFLQESGKHIDPLQGYDILKLCHRRRS